MKIIIGQIVFILALIGASTHLKQGGSSYYDAVAFWIVLFGTISVGVMTAPIFKFKTIWKEFLLTFKNVRLFRQSMVKDLLEVIKGKTGHLIVERHEHKLILDGLELIKLGFDKEKIKNILTQRANNLLQDSTSIASWIRGMSKYPPAFGLIGTILGLINLMRGLSEGADPKQTGLSMAIALVATLYGLLCANLIVNPIGERMKKNLDEKIILMEMAIDTVLMIKTDVNMLEAQEVLNSYIGLNGKEAEGAFMDNLSEQQLAS